MKLIDDRRPVSVIFVSVGNENNSQNHCRFNIPCTFKDTIVTSGPHEMQHKILIGINVQSRLLQAMENTMQEQGHLRINNTSVC